MELFTIVIVLGSIAFTVVLIVVILFVVMKIVKGASGNRELLHTGTPALAGVLGVGETGTTINDAPVVQFHLEVRPEVGSPYQVHHREMMPRLLMGAVLPGLTLPIRIDPQNPQRITIDWNAAGSHLAAQRQAPPT